MTKKSYKGTFYRGCVTIAMSLTLQGQGITANHVRHQFARKGIVFTSKSKGNLKGCKISLSSLQQQKGKITGTMRRTVHRFYAELSSLYDYNELVQSRRLSIELSHKLLECLLSKISSLAAELLYFTTSPSTLQQHPRPEKKN